MSNRRDNYPGPIPKRWLRCPIKSDYFISEKFIAFKTPLSEKFDSQVGDDSFYPQMLFEIVKDYYKKKLGLWIDLTNTDRFYKRSDIEMSDCQYVKLKCRGFGETPSPEQTKAFIELVDEFSAEHPIDIIGVHCTHGFNRTGFLISAYLVEKFDFDVAAAIQQFAAARPPGIYKQDYINELYKRYGDEDDEPLRAPPLPDWCFDEEDGPDDEYQESESSERTLLKRSLDDDNESPDEGTTSSSGPPKKKKRKFEQLKLNATFMPGVPGVTLMTDPKKVNPLQHIIQDMCEWRSEGFPGSQPVSMDRNNLKLLHMKPYKVSWKADGTRYMMLIKHRDEIYFFDRDNSCFKIDGLTFIKRDLQSHITNTLLDGEMVIDIHKGTSTPRYLIYDIVYLENENVGKKTFSDRMKIINDRIIKPRWEALHRGIINRANEPFGIRMKDFWNVADAYKLLSDKFAKQLSHEPDGLIFQPKLEPYVSGRCDEVLKWKPSEQNSVDFKLKITQDSGTGILSRNHALLYVGGYDMPFAEMKYTKSLKELNNKIIECKWDPINNGWTFMRVRTDKSFPNAHKTAMAVCESIKHPVTKEMLLDFIKKHRFKDDSELMGPPH